MKTTVHAYVYLASDVSTFLANSRISSINYLHVVIIIYMPIFILANHIIITDTNVGLVTRILVGIFAIFTYSYIQ